MQLEVLYDDEDLVAVAKPSGLAVHRGWAKDPVTLVDLLREQLALGTVHIVHRLDRGTSGVVLVARHADSARQLGAAFDAREVHKRYLALVRGVAPPDGLIAHAIPRSEGGPRVEAVTAFRRLAAVATEPRHLSLVEAAPRTGRLHQVRRHLKHIDHPVIGDANYGKGKLNRALRDRYGIARLALHACALSLRHPRHGSALEICAPLPDDLRSPLEAMGFEGRHLP